MHMHSTGQLYCPMNAAGVPFKVMVHGRKWLFLPSGLEGVLMGLKATKGWMWAGDAGIPAGGTAAGGRRGLLLPSLPLLLYEE